MDINTIPTRHLRSRHRQQAIDLLTKIYEEKQRQVLAGRLKPHSFAKWETTVLTNRTIQQLGDNNLRGQDLGRCTIYWLFDQVMHCPTTRRSDLWRDIDSTWGPYALMGQRVYDEFYPEEEDQGLSPLDQLLSRAI